MIFKKYENEGKDLFIRSTVYHLQFTTEYDLNKKQAAIFII